MCRYNVRFMRIFVEVEIVLTKKCTGHSSEQIQAPRPRRAVALVTWVERLKLIFYFSFIEQYSFTLLAVICA